MEDVFPVASVRSTCRPSLPRRPLLLSPPSLLPSSLLPSSPPPPFLLPSLLASASVTRRAGLAAGFTETPSTANGLVFLDYQRFLAFLPIFYLGMMEVTPARLAVLRALSLPWGWVATLASLLCLCGAAWSGHCFDELQRWVWVDTPYANDSGAHPGGGGVDTSRGVAGAQGSGVWAQGIWAHGSGSRVEHLGLGGLGFRV